MPLYEYSCRDCDAQFEKLVKPAGESRVVACPKCGSKRTSRLLSVFAVAKGSSNSASRSTPQGMCGRCGGPGPCAMDS
ncbi:MAG: FmdB family zinc ribbon protein [Tepidisphaeraceae bacterium]